MAHEDAHAHGGHHVEITMQGLAKFIGAAGGLLATFVLVQPWTVYYLGALKMPLVGTLLATTVFFAVVLARRRGRRRPRWVAMLDATKTRTLWLLVAASAVSGTLLVAWSQPTRQQVAQQILNDRGMFLRRLYYKTALEVANVGGVALFHDAGFSRTLAFELLGEQAETVPDRRSVDVLLALSDAELTGLLSVVADTEPSAASYALIDKPIRYRSSDAGVDIPGRAAPRGTPPAEPNRAREELLSSTGLPLLGHAVLREQTDKIDLLLRLGADARLAALPLAGVGALPPSLNLLAVDPFLFVAQRANSISSSQPISLLSDFQAAGLAPSRFADEALTELKSHAPSRARPCDAAQTSDTPKRFLGYRYITNAGYALGEFKVERPIGCTRYATHVEGQLRFDSTDMTAVLTTVTADGRAEELTLAGLTVADDTGAGWTHFVGDVSASGDAFTATEGNIRMAFAASTRSLDQAHGILASNADGAMVSCQSLTAVLREQPTTLQCAQWAEIQWDVQAKPRLLVVTDVRTKERRLMMSTERTRFLLRPGNHVASAIPLSADVGNLQIAYAISTPQVGPTMSDPIVAGWPVKPFEIKHRISAEAEQFIHLQLDQTADVSLNLTNLESDVDIFLTGNANSRIDYQSTNGGAVAESINAALPPGRYAVRLQALDQNSPYTLAISSTEWSPRPLGQINGRGPRRVEVAIDDAGMDLFSFDVDAPTTVAITVTPANSGTPADTDMDMELLDRNLQVLAESSNLGLQPERVRQRVDAGSFYVRVFPYDDASPHGYTLIVEDEDPE